MSDIANPSRTPASRRRSQRVLMQVAIRVRGTDAPGKAFEEDTETLAISAHGASVLLATRLAKGTVVHMQHKGTQEEQQCHVVTLGQTRGSKTEIGLEFSSPRPTFWRVTFPPEDWTPKSPEARTISSGRSDK